MPGMYDGLEGSFSAQLQALIGASGGQVWLNSGYRSKERQAQLYAGAVAKYGEPQAGKYVAPPGHSNHNFGLAGDLGGNLELAHSLAPQFGLTFPMSWEPWHIEPTWARAKRGTDYKNGITDPPDHLQAAGVTKQTVADDPYGHLGNQVFALQELLRGQTPEDLHAQFSQAPPAAPAAPGQTGATHTAAGGDTDAKFLDFVKMHESGGNYSSPSGPGHWAGGAYQVMRDTWAGYGGYARADLAPPEVQDRFAREHLAGIKSALGSDDPGVWAAAWYLGTGGAKQWVASGMDPNYAPPENNGFKVSSYAQQARAAVGV